MTEITLPDASPRDREIQHVVTQLVAAYAFREAAAILNARLREISEIRQSAIERVFLDWRALPEGDREDFLTYAHRLRVIENSDQGGAR